MRRITTSVVHHGGRNRIRGVSLIELIMFIVIVGIGLAGILGVMNLTTRASSDPLIQKQALAIAEAYLEEVLAMPFTYCDPDDVNAATAQSTGPVNPANPARCASLLEGIGPEGESRAGIPPPPFDNVSDYNGFAGVPANVDGTAITGLGTYNVAIAVAAEALSSVPALDGFNRPQSLRVTVTVTAPWTGVGGGATTVVLDGYRTRYAPNSLP